MEIVNYITDSTIECAPFNWGITLFSYGCNLNCAMCKGYNYEKVTNKDNIIGNFIDVIKKNITPLHDCVVFLGGEPTIWKNDLKEALKYCHVNGLKTKIFSNGMLPNIIREINEEKLCDAWSIDFKGLSNLKALIGLEDNIYFEKINDTLYNIIDYDLPLEIRTTFHSENEHERERVKEIVNSKYILPYKEKNPCIYTCFIEQDDIRNITKG